MPRGEIFWTGPRVEILREAYERGGIREARKAFPNVSDKEIYRATWARHITRRRGDDVDRPQSSTIVDSAPKEPPRTGPVLVASRGIVITGSLWTAADIAKMREAFRAGGTAAAIAATKNVAVTDGASGTQVSSRHSGQNIASADDGHKPGTFDAAPVRAAIIAVDPPAKAASQSTIVNPMTNCTEVLPADVSSTHNDGRGMTVRAGSLDGADREFVKRRIDFTVMQLSRELRRTTGAVQDAIRDLASNNFRSAALYRINFEREDAYGMSDLQAEHSVRRRTG